MSDVEILIDIPNKVEYARPLHCTVDPPQSHMTIEFAAEGETEPFRIGYIKGRRIAEIAGFVFRPRRNQLNKKQIDKPLVAPCKITTTVKIYDTYTDEKGYGKIIKEQSQVVEVVASEKSQSEEAPAVTEET